MAPLHTVAGADDGRTLFPRSGFTTTDAVAYYRSVATHLLPHLRRRPLSFRRFPDTIDGDSFWEKDAPSFTPHWVKTHPVPRREAGAPIRYIVADSLRTLTWIASVGGIELHPFLHRVPRIAVPTAVVFDLDPGPDATLLHCAKVSLILRDALRLLGLESFAKVSGSKGIQVFVPLNPASARTAAGHESTTQFARNIADTLARAHPRLIVSKMTKTIRRGRVFIDWSQNADYKTTVAVYSLRARHDPPLVSMPVRWEELDKPRIAALEFSPEAAIARLRRVGDLFAPVLTLRQKLPGIESGTALPAVRDVRFEAAESPLPRPGSQSGRRLYLLTKTETGNELWLDHGGKFKRWILRPDREYEGLVAMPAGEFTIEDDYAAGRVPSKWKGRVTIEESGAYEVIEGSLERKRLALWFSGRILSGPWTLAKINPAKKHRSWSLHISRGGGGR